MRDLDTLLQLDTYQDMSDEEIDSVIDYRVACAVQSAEFKLEANYYQMQAEIAHEREMQKANDAKELLYQLIDNPPYARKEVVGDGTSLAEE